MGGCSLPVRRFDSAAPHRKARLKMNIVCRVRICAGMGWSTDDVDLIKHFGTCPSYLPVAGMNLIQLDGPYESEDSRTVFASGPIEQVNIIKANGDEWFAECIMSDVTRRQRQRRQPGEQQSMDEIVQEYLDEGWELVDA